MNPVAKTMTDMAASRQTTQLAKQIRQAKRIRQANQASRAGAYSVGAPAVIPASDQTFGWSTMDFSVAPNVVWQDTSSAATYTSAASVLNTS